MRGVYGLSVAFVLPTCLNLAPGTVSGFSLALGGFYIIISVLFEQSKVLYNSSFLFE